MTRTDRSGGRPDYVPEAAREGPAKQRQQIMDRKERFEELNKLAIKSGDSWLVSVPGDFEVRVEALPTSTFPQRLRDLDYRLRDEGQGERILAHAIVERFARGADGALVPITVGSTSAIVHRVMHAGIVKTRQWSFAID